MAHFEIRQQVKTVEKNWLETIHKEQSLRVLEVIYDGLVKNNPDNYFELVRVTHEEECLAYTQKATPNVELRCADRRRARTVG